jgi:hypothetical protein
MATSSLTALAEDGPPRAFRPMRPDERCRLPTLAHARGSCVDFETERTPRRSEGAIRGTPLAVVARDDAVPTERPARGANVTCETNDIEIVACALEETRVQFSLGRRVEACFTGENEEGLVLSGRGCRVLATICRLPRECSADLVVYCT